jgi:outer membrane protein
MKKRVVLFGILAALSLGAIVAQQPAAPAPTPAQPQPQDKAGQAPAEKTAPVATAVRVGIINIQRAIIECNEGKKAAEELTKRFTPKRAELERKQKEIEDLQGQLEKGKNTLADDKRAELIRDIERKTKDFNRDNDDATADFQQAESQLINTIGQKVMRVVDEYSRRNGYDVILDVSNPQSNVLWATNKLDVTDEIIGAYNMVGSSLQPLPAAGNPARPGATPGAKGPAPAAKAPPKQ